jgi:hypothetical protein
VNVYWEGSDGVHGAISSESGPFSFSDLTNEITGSAEVAGADNIGAYYMSVADEDSATLEVIQQDSRVLLVDVGRYEEFVNLTGSGGCARFALPDPLWFAAKEFGQNGQ